MEAEGESTLERISVIGAGHAGTSMAFAIHSVGYIISAVASRSLSSARRCAELVGCNNYSTDPVKTAKSSDVVIISTPDDVIGDVCDRIASGGGFVSRQIVMHLSGSQTSDILGSARNAGARVLSFHPIQSLPHPQDAPERLKGAFVSIEGDSDAIPFGMKFARELGGIPFEINTKLKPLYHSALCVASNYLVAIADLSVELLRSSGISNCTDPLEVILPLMRGTLENLKAIGLPDALTGPISRGDVGTIESHMVQISQNTPDLLDYYRLLGKLTVNIALRKGTIDTSRASEILSTISSKDR